MADPTEQALARAGALQDANRRTEAAQEIVYGPDDAAGAAVRAREDIGLLVSLSIDQHRQLVMISRAVWTITILLAVIAAALLHRR